MNFTKFIIINHWPFWRSLWRWKTCDIFQLQLVRDGKKGKKEWNIGAENQLKRPKRETMFEEYRIRVWHCADLFYSLVSASVWPHTDLHYCGPIHPRRLVFQHFTTSPLRALFRFPFSMFSAMCCSNTRKIAREGCRFIGRERTVRCLDASKLKLKTTIEKKTWRR